MARGGISFSVEGVGRYRAVAKRMRQAGRKDLRSKLRQKIVETGKPIREEIQDTVRHLPVKGTRGGGAKQRRNYNVERAAEKSRERARRRGAGLRETVANATQLQITAKGVRFIINSERLPEKQQSLPRHLDSPKGWRHPTFGKRGKDDWVHEQGKPYFAITIKKYSVDFRKAILAAVDEIRKEIEGW